MSTLTNEHILSVIDVFEYPITMRWISTKIRETLPVSRPRREIKQLLIKMKEDGILEELPCRPTLWRRPN